MGSAFAFEYEFLKGTFFTCSLCNYAWRTRTSGTEPRSCPSCGTRLWKESYVHTCAKCGYGWTSSHESPRKCPCCQSTRWSERDEVIVSSDIPEERRNEILARYRAGHGAVKISMELGITFSDVFDVLVADNPETDIVM